MSVTEKYTRWVLKDFFIFVNKHKKSIFYATVLFPILVWLSILYAHHYSFNIYHLWHIHYEHSILFVIDLLPLTSYLGFKILKHINDRDEEIIALFQQKEELFDKYTVWAETLGKGELISYFNGAATASNLGMALHTLQENIIKTREQEELRHWHMEGLNLISDIIRASVSLDEMSYRALSRLIQYTGLIQGAFYVYDEVSNSLVNTATYAYNRQKFINQKFKIGQGLIGQAAFEMASIYRKEIPEDYISIKSGLLGETPPASILIVPLVADEKIQGVIEVASLQTSISEKIIHLIEASANPIAQSVFNLKANLKTEKLLSEAQSFATELKKNEDVLRQNADQMKKTQEQLSVSNKTLEIKINEAENSERRLHSILQNASEVITIYDKQGSLKYESPSMKHVFGHSEHEIKLSGLFYNLSPTGHPLLTEAFQYVIKNPYKVKIVEYKYAKKSGDVVWLETTVRNMLQDNALRGIIFNTRDITIHKLAEREQRMKGQMQALSENSPDMIVRLNQEGVFFYTNPVFEYFTGYKYKDVMKKFIEQVTMDKAISDFLLNILTRMITNPVAVEEEVTFPSPAGNRIMHVNAIPEFSEEKVFETVLIVAHDITVSKQIETEIKDKNKKINESINYARHIQDSILPNTELIREYLPESFIFYIPKDVVSGDFPWFFKKGDSLYIAAVDCTGHGVPGAMLSFIGFFTLNTILNHQNDYDAAEILTLLHEQVRRTLRQDSPNATTRDGMDIALCRINLNDHSIDFAGAHRPLLLLRENEIIQYDADRKAIGGIPLRNKPEKPFTNHHIEMKKKDRIFFFSDGLPDQEGGPSGFKYNTLRIKDHILNNKNRSMDDLSKLFATDFQEWKTGKKQMDDILLIGIEF